jgi:hypothetical protein
MMWEEPIPNDLYNEDLNKPHQNCKLCNRSLLDGEVYAIQKVFKNYPEQDKAQTLFDFALCNSCLQETRSQLSIASRQRIDAYMMAELQTLEEIGENPRSRYNERKCTLSGQQLSKSQEYQMMAICQGPHILESPICLSDTVLEAIQDLLSPESRAELDRFTENNFGWPPELKKLWQDGDFVLL